MNDIFNIHRFFRLLNKHTMEHLKKYLFSVAILIIILALNLGSALYNNNDGQLPQKLQLMIFTSTFIIGGIIFTSMMFLEFSDKRKAIAELTLPVSALERFLVLWFYSFVVYQVTMLICFYTVDLIAVHIGNQLTARTKHPFKNEVLALVTEKNNVFRVFYGYGLFHAVSFFGAIFFKKLHLIKTIFFLSFFVFLIVQFNKLIISLMFDSGVSAGMVFTGLNIKENTDYYMVEPNASGLLIITVTMIVLTFVLWAAAFFKLKEKQV